MVEFYGWIHLAPWDDGGAQKQVISQVRTRIDHYDWKECLLTIQVSNGAFHLHTGGVRNRHDQYVAEIMDLYRWISTLSPDSFGLLYYWNDEEADERRDRFRVYVLAGGELSERADPFLSPISQKIDPSYWL